MVRGNDAFILKVIQAYLKDFKDIYEEVKKLAKKVIDSEPSSRCIAQQSISMTIFTFGSRSYQAYRYQSELPELVILDVRPPHTFRKNMLE